MTEPKRMPLNCGALPHSAVSARSCGSPPLACVLRRPRAAYAPVCACVCDHSLPTSSFPPPQQSVRRCVTVCAGLLEASTNVTRWPHRGTPARLLVSVCFLLRGRRGMKGVAHNKPPVAIDPPSVGILACAIGPIG